MWGAVIVPEVRYMQGVTTNRSVWRNWQTRRVQVPVPVRACGFDSHHGHNERGNDGERVAEARWWCPIGAARQG